RPADHREPGLSALGRCGGGPVSGTLPAVLAVDGGNSKSDLALVADDGSLLASVRGPGMTKPDLATTLGLLTSLIDQAQRQAGGPGCPVARHLSACVANADLPEEEEALAAALRAQGWTGTTEVVNDTFAVLRAGLDAAPDGLSPTAGPAPPAGGAAERHWGVAVTCGAGINCVGVAPDGRHARFPALGRITGDWGGGYDLGLTAVFAAARSEDGRGPRTSLEHAVPAHFGLEAPSKLAEAIHFGQIAQRRVIELAPVVLAEAADDAVAAEIVQ